MTPFALMALPTSRAEGERVARRLGVPLGTLDIHAFADGEIRVTIGAPGRTTALIASLDRPDTKLIALLLAAEALRREGCRRLVLVAPYLCYMRQDAAFHPGEAISARAIGHLLAGTADRLVTFDAHLHRSASLADLFPGIVAENHSPVPAIAAALAPVDPASLVVGPDAQAASRAGALAHALGVEALVCAKQRHADGSVRVSLPDKAVVRGRHVLVFDDLVVTGTTLINCAETLRHAGAASVDAIVTHALSPPEKRAVFARAGLRSLRSTTSVPHPTNVFALDALIAAALAAETKGEPT